MKSLAPIQRPKRRQDQIASKLERKGQPDDGWSVDVENRKCPCMYHFKYGVCVHLYSAALHVGVRLPGVKDHEKRFHSRRKGSRNGGRLPRAGHALSFR